MTHQSLLVMVGDDRLHISRVDGSTVHVKAARLSDKASAQEIAEVVDAHLGGAGNLDTSQDYSDEQQQPSKRTGSGTCVLGVPSSWCLCGTVTVPELTPRQQRTAMLYALEEKLPVPAEDVVADFVVAGDKALGIAVEIDRLRGLVNALEDQGIAVDAICPTALLALQHLYENNGSDASTIAWRDPDGLNLFEFDAEGRLEHWRWFANSGDAFDSLAELSDAEKKFITQNQDGAASAELIQTTDLLEAASLMADQIHTGKADPFLNLRRDALDASDRMRRVRAHLLAAMTAAAVLLLSILVTCWWRAHQYQQAQHGYESTVTALYHDTFGNQPRPTSVKRRFDTRLRELRGLRGEQVDDASELQTTSALWLLSDMLERLPTDRRLCLLDISIEQDRLTLTGQVRNHSDADLIASALRQDGRFEVEPPSTSNLKDGGVSFTLGCTASEQTPPTPTKPVTIPEIAGATAQGRVVVERGVTR